MHERAEEYAREAMRLRAEGLSWSEAAERIGKPKSNLRYWAKSLGLWAPSGAPTSTEAEPTETAPDGYESPPDQVGTTYRQIDDNLAEVEARFATVHTLDQLLDAMHIDRKVWRPLDPVVNRWGGGATPMWQIKCKLERIPEWTRTPVLPKAVPVRTQVNSRCSSALLVPDQQFGFRWDFDSRTLEPLHDPAACALAVEVAQRMQPDVIVMLGDVLDLAAFSTKYVSDPALKNTATPTLQAAHDHFASFRAACPAARIIMLPGNHDERVAKAATTYIPELVHAKAANDSKCLLALERLLALDSIGVELAPGGYPKAEVWLFNGKVRVTHGKTVKSGGGATAAAVVKKADVSTYYGHIHSAELAARTIHGDGRARTIYAGSPGTLCRLTGIVPGSHRPDWQQGVMELHELGGTVVPTLVHFAEGEAVWRGVRLSAAA